jgi:hypothetical protein
MPMANYHLDELISDGILAPNRVGSPEDADRYRRDRRFRDTSRAAGQ